MNLIPEKLTAAMVRSYIDFDGQAAAGLSCSQAKAQSEGVAALWHLLEGKGFAYLADEVGMGKTRQAMGVIATQFLRKPDSRVAIICSGETLQTQWQSEWSTFLQSCYKIVDGRLLGTDARVLEPLHMHENLNGFVPALVHDETRIHLLRYSSFSRPLSLGDGDFNSALAKYAKSVSVDSAEKLSESERKIAAAFNRRTDKGWQHELAHELAESYCARIAAFLTRGLVHDENGQVRPRHPFDLVIFDEAQNLRHTDNMRNTNIARIFRGNAERWLFMSATPLHAGEGDLRSLDHYLCPRLVRGGAEGVAVERADPRSCGNCKHELRCSQVARQLREGKDIKTILEQMMVRRTRRYVGHDGRQYDKIEYRHYEPVRYSGAEDPFYALTMALVQKQLAGILAGKNNRFRQGECASFESLASSVRRGQQRLGAPVHDYEPNKDGKRPEEPGVAVDRTAIDLLNRSFGEAMSVKDAVLPHAKLNNAVDMLFERSLRRASVDKTLVFVRRIDSVGEIRDLLHVRFQQEIDARIRDWRVLLGRFTRLRARVWRPDGFWESRTMADAIPVPITEGDEDPSPKGSEGGSFREAVVTKYFAALQRAPRQNAKNGGPDQNAGSAVADPNAKNGKLVSFKSRLLNAKDPSDNPLRGFLLKRQEADGHEQIWEENQDHWRDFLEAVLGKAGVEVLRAEPAQRFLFADTTLDSDDAWKLGALQRCLLEAMRQSDFIIDLYILNTHLAGAPDDDSDLPEKLLWLLNHAENLEAPELADYIANWKEKFRRWILHFDLIADKSFRGGAATDWREICTERVKTVFHGLAPVVGRSGDIENKYAVAQFNFPGHPNVLVCTDVLKEGVDMHLFCDQIMHYGVAWTSGDLEQRIGRIDRLGSLIGRRIEGHKDGASEMPRLGVKFPYLDGTLDRHQVCRVIQEKYISDQRMDLGKRRDENGELDAGALGTLDSLHVSSEAVPAVFFPVSARFACYGNESIAWPESIPRKRAGQQVRPWQAGDEAANSENYLPAFGCIRVLRRIENGARLLRRSLAPSMGTATQLTEEILVPAGGDATVSAACTLREAGPAGIYDSHDRRFRLCDAVNTLTWQPEISSGVAPIGRRVLLETINNAVWLLRVGVCASLAMAKNYEQIMATENRKRRWGYLAEDAGYVWFCVMVQAASGAVWDLLARLAERMVRAAWFYRSMLLSAGFEWEEPAYRSRRAFPSAGVLRGIGRDISAAHLSAAMARQGISAMKQEDLLLCGQLLSGVRVWFNEIFEAVLERLYEDESAERGLKIVPVKYLDGGVLHLSTEGNERFRMQVYLDLGDVSRGKKFFVGPKMIWELAVSPHSSGPRPELPLSEFDAFPHVSDSGWEGKTSGQCGVFTYLDKRGYRYIVVYHTPRAWESESGRLLAAWGAVRDKMQGTDNYQRQYCRDEFLNLLGETPCAG